MKKLTLQFRILCISMFYPHYFNHWCGRETISQTSLGQIGYLFVRKANQINSWKQPPHFFSLFFRIQITFCLTFLEPHLLLDFCFLKKYNDTFLFKYTFHRIFQPYSLIFLQRSLNFYCSLSVGQTVFSLTYQVHVSFPYPYTQ